MDKKELTFDALVIGIQKTYYLLEVQNFKPLEGKQIKGTLSGKMRMNKIKVIIGDMVKVEIDQYDLTKGRIIFRQKIENKTGDAKTSYDKKRK